MDRATRWNQFSKFLLLRYALLSLSPLFLLSYIRVIFSLFYSFSFHPNASSFLLILHLRPHFSFFTSIFSSSFLYSYSFYISISLVFFSLFQTSSPLLPSNSSIFLNILVPNLFPLCFFSPSFPRFLHFFLLFSFLWFLFFPVRRQPYLRRRINLQRQKSPRSHSICPPVTHTSVALATPIRYVLCCDWEKIRLHRPPQRVRSRRKKKEGDWADQVE